MKFKSNMLMVLISSTALVTSCIVSDKYSIDDVDMEMTLFEDKFELPIGNTGKLKLGDFLDGESSDMLKVLSDGSYSFSMGGDFELGDKLPDMADFLSIKGMNFSESFKYSIGDFKDGVISIPGDEFHNSVAFGDFSNLKDFDIAPVDFKSSLAESISEMMPDASNFSLGIEPFNYTLGNLFDVSGINPSMIGSGEFSIPSQYLPDAEVSESVKISYENSLPEGENIKDVKLASDSEIVLSISTSSSFLSSGSIVADLDVDFGSLFIFQDGSSKVNLKSIALDAANGFSNTASYKVKGIDKSCFKGNTISVNSDVTVNGSVSVKDGKTNSNLLSSAKQLGVDISISCDGIKFDDITFEVKNHEVAEETSVDVKFNDITLPEQVQSVESISFTDDSSFTLGITPKNLPSTLDVTLSQLVVSFPPEITVEGAVDGKITYLDVNLSQPFSRTVKVKSVSIPAAKDGKISFAKKVAVTAKASLSGDINTSALSSDSADAFDLEVAVSSNLSVADYSAKIKQMTVSLAQEDQKFEIELPDGLENFGTFVIVPEGTPTVKFRLNLPSTSLSYKASSDGIVIKIPQMLELGTVAAALNFDKKTNSITIKGDIPSEIVLPVSKIVATPQKNDEGKSVVSGVFTISGGVVVPSATISKKDVDEIAKNGVGVDVVIPEIKSSDISMDKLDIKIDSEQEITILKAGSVPSEIKSISSAILDATTLSLDVAFNNLPSVGAGKSFDVNVDITLPDFIKPSTVSLKGQIKDGKFSAVPVALESLDFSSFDLSKDIKGTFKFVGGISVDNPSVSISALKGDVSATINGSISDIKIKEVVGKVDYKLDNVSESVKIEGLPEFLSGGDAVLDLYNPALNISMVTNLGIPVKGSLVIHSMKNGRETASQSVEIELPYSNDGSKVSRTFHLASSSENCPSDFEFRKVDFSSLIKVFPDELVVEVVAGTDPDKECTISSTAKYELNCSYEFNMPLALGKDFRVELKDTLDLSEDVAKYLDKAETVLLYGSVENSLPVQIGLELGLLDANGNTVPLSSPVSQTIKAANSDGTASVSPLEIALSHSSSIAAARQIKLTFVVTSGGAAGNCIKESDYVQAVLGAALKGGVTIDPKNF